MRVEFECIMQQSIHGGMVGGIEGFVVGGQHGHGSCLPVEVLNASPSRIIVSKRHRVLALSWLNENHRQ